MLVVLQIRCSYQKKAFEQVENQTRIHPCREEVKRMPRLLELCCGSKSVSKYFEAQGWECITVDIDKKFEPTIVARCAGHRSAKYLEGG